MTRHTLWTLVLLGCVGDHVGNPGDCVYGQETQGVAGTTRYVCATVPAGGDGSVEAPFRRLEEALRVSGGDDRILIAAGEYAEQALIRRPVRLVGAGRATRLMPPTGLAGIEAQGVDGLALVGLEVIGSTTAGIWLRGGNATVDQVWVRGTRPDAQGAFGYGILAVDGAELSVVGGEITESAGYGLLAVDASVSLLDLIARGNGGGLRIESGQGALRAVQVVDNRGVGVVFLDSGGSVLESTLRGTVAEASGAGGDGLVVAARAGGAAAATTVRVESTLIERNARFGVLVDGFGGLRLQGSQIEANEGGGLWAQHAAPDGRSTIEGCAFRANERFGVVAIDEAAIRLADSEINGTIEAPFLADFTIGDGVGIYLGAEAEIEGNAIRGSGRAGAVFDGAQVAFIDNEVDEDRYAVVLQAEAMVELLDNRFPGVADEIFEPPPGEELPVFSAADVIERDL